jgi:acyl-coenzyme A thioesterase PaaI-like protein
MLPSRVSRSEPRTVYSELNTGSRLVSVNSLVQLTNSSRLDSRLDRRERLPSTSTYPNALYAVLRAESAAQSAEAGRTILPLGNHLRHEGGLRISALGLAAEHGTSSFALDSVGAVPTALSVSQRGVPDDLDALELHTWTRHRGRTIMVTSMEAFRPGDATDRLAFGQITWAVRLPAPPAAPSRGVSTDGLADLLAIAGIEESDGSAAIRAARPDILGPGGILHAGALQTLAEHAALRAAREAGHGSTVYTSDAAFQFARGAKQGPFTAYPHVLAAAPGLPIDVEVEVRDGDDRLCTLATLRVVLP